MEKHSHIKHVWTTDEFIKQYESSDVKIFDIFKEKIQRIINHWKLCRSCRAGFCFTETEGDFEDIVLKLAFYPENHYTCDEPNNQLSYFERYLKSLNDRYQPTFSLGPDA